MIGIFKKILGGGVGKVFDYLDKRGKRQDSEKARQYELLIAGIESTRFSWKDEYITIIITAPFVLGVIFSMFNYSDGVTRVIEAVSILDSFPKWYQDIFFYVCMAAIGLTGLVKPGLRVLNNRGRNGNGGTDRVKRVVKDKVWPHS